MKLWGRIFGFIRCMRGYLGKRKKHNTSAISAESLERLAKQDPLVNDPFLCAQGKAKIGNQQPHRFNKR